MAEFNETPIAAEVSESKEGQSFEITPDAEAIPDRVPVEITQEVGDRVAIKGVVVDVEGDALTIEIDDGLENNRHRITLNSNQVDAAVINR